MLPRFFESYALACPNGTSTDTVEFTTVDSTSVAIQLYSSVAVSASIVFIDSSKDRETVVALGAIPATTVSSFVKSIYAGAYIGSRAVLRITNASGGPGVVDVFCIMRG